MLVHDPIYGDFAITDPLAIELVETTAFQRLKKINQFGLTRRHYPMHRGFFRYEHCLGVYILLNRLGATRQEQIAGLLHDISHTAFSHLIDWIINLDPRLEDYQHSIHLSILRRPELAAILQRYGFLPETIADLESFGLLERPTSELCADRVDYSLREMQLETVKRTLAAIDTQNGEIIFNDWAAASEFANAYLQLHINNWSSYEAVTRFEILSQLFKRAIEAGDLTFADFETDDEAVLAKIVASGKGSYRKTLALLERTDLSDLPKAEKVKFKKFR